MRRTADSSLTPQQLADVIGVSKHKILAHIRDGKIGAVRYGTRYRVPIAEAIRYLTAMRYPVPAALKNLRPYTIH